MTKMTLWRAADAAAHFLYAPSACGQRSARARWHHRIHLIPGPLFRWICDGAERFYEDDEPVESIRAAFDAAEKGVTRRPVGYRCQHMSITAGGGALTNVSSGCGCLPEPMFAQ